DVTCAAAFFFHPLFKRRRSALRFQDPQKIVAAVGVRTFRLELHPAFVTAIRAEASPEQAPTGVRSANAVVIVNSQDGGSNAAGYTGRHKRSQRGA
ncbi:MAG: hypothetical protein ACRELF_22625, partial [Gemmataceae bacterium]